ncbi:hypothetical protein [Marinoscillum pacificum]|uniref:hypothetical protein n=1 Tax=Marinoscillum pacificum TaxID=392723 RepID=UPI002158922F|nr:hypothetical protein [Marinoscillum pacificum]
MKIAFSIFWIFITVGSLSAQSISQTIELAEKSFELGQYENAASFYKRVLFFDKSGDYDSLTVEGLAWSSYLSGDYEVSSKYFKTLTRMKEDQGYELMEILSLMKQSDFLNAKRSVLAYRPANEFGERNRQIMKSLIDFQLGDYDRAKEGFLKLDASTDQLEDVYKAVDKVNRKTKMKAILLSAIFPGSGQAYSKHYKEGINSLITISAFGAAYVFTITNYGIVVGLISVSPWFQRYYVGGMNSAADLLVEYKAEQFDQLYNQLVSEYAGMIQVNFE